MSSSTNKTTSPSAGFISLGKGIYIKKAAAEPALSAETPSIILIFGWMSAAMPHLLKYTKAYDDLYPSATQLLVRSEPSYFWSFESTVRENLMPLVEALEALECIEPAKTGERIEREETPLRILTHCFSNGGGCNLSTLHRVITSQQLVTRRQVISILVLDSVPGRGGYENAKAGFAPAFKNPVAYFCVSAFLAGLYATAWIRGHLVDGVPKFFVDMEEDLNSENLVGWMGKKTSRLYLYSEKDELIPPDGVDEHAAKAAAKGFNVKLEKFAESKHVSHARMYPERYWGAIRERYWGAIRDVWEQAVLSA